MNATKDNSFLTPISRRRFTQGMGLTAVAASAGFLSRHATAAGSVNFLGWQGYDEPVLFDDFAKNNGINVNTTYIGNNDEIITKLRSGGVGQIDIVTPYMGYIPVLVALDLIQPIDVSRVPNLEKVLPLFRNDKNVNVDGKLYSVPFTWGSAPLVYDPAVVTTAPSGWKELLKPEFAGKVGMMDDPLGNVTLAGLIATDAEVPTKLTPDQLKAAIDFLIEVKKQSRVVAVSWGDLADAMARGDVAATFNGWETLTKFCADKGKTVKYIYAEEGTYAWLDNYCIAKDAPNLDAAYTLSNRVIDAAAQKHLAENALQGIVNQDAIAALDPSVKALYPYDAIEDFGKKARFYEFPPIKADGTHATYGDWMKEYERFKTA
jgi:spermidine/putrescine transport system substrate-binding protein